MRARKVWPILAIIAALVLGIGAVFSFPGARSGLARTLLSVALKAKGFQLVNGDVRLGSGQLIARDLVINDAAGLHFVSAKDIQVGYVIAGTSLSIKSVRLVQPHLSLRKAADGSFNFSRLTGGAPGPAASPTSQGGPAKPLALHLNVAVRDGKIEFENRFAPARPGRYFAVEGINVAANLDQGRFSAGRFHGELTTGKGKRPIDATFLENDRLRMAQIRAHASEVPLAPILDLLISAPAFTVEKGTGDVTLRGYALGWPSESGPQWHISAQGMLHHGRLRVIPLIAPARDLSGPFQLYDGTLTFARLTGTAAQVPLTASGAISISPSVSLNLSINAAGQLERARNLLAVLKPLPLHGPIVLHVRVRGVPSNPRVAVGFRALKGLVYGRTPISFAAGSLSYSEKHVTSPGVTAAYAGFRISGNGDLDLSNPGPPLGRFVAVVRGPASAIPWIANLDKAGTLTANALFEGPLAKLQGNGFVELSGTSTRIRTAFSGSFDKFSFGPLLATDRDGGSLWFAATVDRAQNFATDAHLIAHDFHLRLNGRRTKLPGIFDVAYGIPAASGVIDGVISASGPLLTPTFVTELRGWNMLFAGADYGRFQLQASGVAGRAHIADLALEGPAAKLHARGDVMRQQRSGAIKGSVRGWTVADLDKFSAFAPVGGLAMASFAAQFGNHELLAALRLHDSKARIAGVPLQTANVVLGADAHHLRVYSASAQVAGGRLIADGELADASREPHFLSVAADRIQVADLRTAGLPLTNGEVSAFGRISGTPAHPAASFSGALSGASVASRSVDADAQLVYKDNALTSKDSRLYIGGTTAIDVSGSVSGLLGTGSPANAALRMQGQIRDADLHALYPAQMGGLPMLTGSANGVVQLGGTLAAPSFGGFITSETGSVHGVSYQNLHANVAGTRNGVSIASGRLVVGSTPLRVAGTLSTQQTRISLQSPHLDLSDFNDFFNGADVLEGVGSTNLTLATSPSLSSANGYVSLNRAAVAAIPLGSLRATLSTRRAMIHALIRQHGQLAGTVVQGSVAFPRHVGMLPDVKHAIVDTSVSARDIDLSMLAPFLPSSAEGLRGQVNIAGSARGKVPQIRGTASFAVRHGFIRKDPITEFSGRVDSDGRGIALNMLRASMNGVILTGRGSFGRNQRISAHAVMAARDIATVSRVARINSPIRGAVELALDAAGTLQQPLVHVLLTAAPGSVYGVAYDGVNVDANYAPGRIGVRNASTQLSQRRGALAIDGVVPIPVGPQPARRQRRPQPIRLNVNVNAVDLAAFDPLLHTQGSLNGRFDLHARVGGTLAKPKMAGAATLRGAAIRSKLETNPLTALNADVAFSNDSIEMPYLHGSIGRGTIDASASARVLPPARGSSVGALAYAIRFIANRAAVNVPHFFSGAIDADLAFTSNHARPVLAGNVMLSNTDVPFSGILALASGSPSGSPPQAGSVPGVPPLRPGHSISYGGSIYGSQPHLVEPTAAPVPVKKRLQQSAPIALDITANAGKNVALTGLVDATGEGSVHVGGSASAPKLDGTLTAIRGQVGLFDTVFHLLRGSVTFDPPDGFLPTLDAQAVAQRPEAEITVTLAGRVDHMQTQLQSDPPMSENAILADILHINQINEALSGGSSQTGGVNQNSALANPGGAVQNFASAALTGKLLSALNYGLEQSLDISEVNFAFDTRGQPNLELRKQYGKNLYALFRTSFQVPPQQSVGIAYRLRDALEMEFVQKQNTAGQNQFDLNQTTMFQVNVRFH